MRQQVLLALLVASGLAGPALAQTTPPATPVPSPTYTRNDTVRAIQRLYDRRRRGGARWFYVSGGGLLTLVRVLVSSSSSTSTYGGYTAPNTTSVDGGAVATVAGLFIALPTAIGVSKLVRFSYKRETEAVNAYVATHRLPQGFGRRLHRKDFR